MGENMALLMKRAEISRILRTKAAVRGEADVGKLKDLLSKIDYFKNHTKLTPADLGDLAQCLTYQ